VSATIYAPELDVANTLVAATSIFSPALALDTDIKLGPRNPADLSTGVTLWVAPTGGPAPERMLNRTVEGSLFQPTVQVEVLSAPDDYSDGVSKARKVIAALDEQTVSIASGGSYVWCKAAQSDPYYLGTTEARRHRFTCNFQLLLKNTN